MSTGTKKTRTRERIETLKAYFGLLAVTYFVVFGIVLHALVVYNALSSKETPQEVSLSIPIAQTRTTVSCESNSMGLTMRCGDELQLRSLDGGDLVFPGRVYTYASENYTVVHRLVACLDADCNVSVFKGDNNVRGELVNRSQIKAWVHGVEYR